MILQGLASTITKKLLILKGLGVFWGSQWGAERGGREAGRQGNREAGRCERKIYRRGAEYAEKTGERQRSKEGSGGQRVPRSSDLGMTARTNSKKAKDRR
jgi:hypothetical protein